MAQDRMGYAAGFNNYDAFCDRKERRYRGRSGWVGYNSGMYCNGCVDSSDGKGVGETELDGTFPPVLRREDRYELVGTSLAKEPVVLMTA